MRSRPRHFRRPPPWWPANEPWPPADRLGWARRGRSGFVRRVGCLFAVLLFLSAVGVTTLLSLLQSYGRTGSTVSTRFPWPLLFLMMLLMVLVVAFFAAMRGVGFPLGDLVEAADRVATGDYSTRVVERGPPSLRSVGRAFNSMTARLEAEDRQRRQIMADIAHELRTPLTVIQGQLEGLLDQVYPRDDARLSDVLDETRILARLVDDLRTLANAESGTLTLQKEPTDLAILIQDVVSAFSVEADTGGVTVRVEATDLPLIEVDPLRIREVLSNLLSNALRYTGRGGSIAIRVEPRADRVVVRVGDTGPGVPAEDLPKIFDRFYKGSASRGSGLGLTIARNLVVAHGGQIRAESEPGQGTTITFDLPTRTRADG